MLLANEYSLSECDIRTGETIAAGQRRVLLESAGL